MRKVFLVALGIASIADPAGGVQSIVGRPSRAVAGALQRAGRRASINHAAAPDLRLISLLTARLCHELVDPITAIGNGVELIVEGDADFAREATALVADSARRAASRLQFYRFAYGFGGGDLAPGLAPGDLAIGFFEASGIDRATIRRRFGSSRSSGRSSLAICCCSDAEGLPRGGCAELGEGRRRAWSASGRRQRRLGRRFPDCARFGGADRRR